MKDDYSTNMFIQTLRKLNTGCHVSGMFVGCLVYADDIILIRPSVNGLQEMLGKCFDISQLLSLQFNTRKCHCLTVGKLSKVNISPMLLRGNKIEWCEDVRYLGVYLMGSKSVKFDISPIKRSFYAACNSYFLIVMVFMKWHYWHSRNPTVYLYCCMHRQHCHLHVNRVVS